MKNSRPKDLAVTPERLLYMRYSEEVAGLRELETPPSDPHQAGLFVVWDWLRAPVEAACAARILKWPGIGPDVEIGPAAQRAIIEVR
jgi:hypothetical protein